MLTRHPGRPATISTTSSDAAPDGAGLTVPPTAAQVEQARTEQVVRWLLLGVRESDIYEAIAATWPGQDPDPLIQAAAGTFRDDADTDPAIIRGWCIAATRELYRKMLEIGDLQGALGAVKVMDKFSSGGAK